MIYTPVMNLIWYLNSPVWELQSTNLCSTTEQPSQQQPSSPNFNLEDHTVDFIRNGGQALGFSESKEGNQCMQYLTPYKGRIIKYQMVLTDCSTWSGSITSASALRTFRKFPSHPKERRLSSSRFFLSLLTFNQICSSIYYVALVVYTKHAKYNHNYLPHGVHKKIRFRMSSAQL